MSQLGLLVDGFSSALTPANLPWALIGVTIGTAVGVLPGIATGCSPARSCSASPARWSGR